jgi:hypothetical protein
VAGLAVRWVVKLKGVKLAACAEAVTNTVKAVAAMADAAMAERNRPEGGKGNIKRVIVDSLLNKWVKEKALWMNGQVRAAAFH